MGFGNTVAKFFSMRDYLGDPDYCKCWQYHYMSWHLRQNKSNLSTSIHCSLLCDCGHIVTCCLQLLPSYLLCHERLYYLELLVKKNIPSLNVGS